VLIFANITAVTAFDAAGGAYGFATVNGKHVDVQFQAVAETTAGPTSATGSTGSWPGDQRQPAEAFAQMDLLIAIAELYEHQEAQVHVAIFDEERGPRVGTKLDVSTLR
jgi:hypothetical protein